MLFIPKTSFADGNIAGTWEGYLTIPELGTESVTAYLEQNGNSVTGKAITSDGCDGTIIGTIEGSILNFTVNGKRSNNCCKSTYKGTAVVTCEEDHMFMTFTLKLKSNCSGKYVGSGEFWKQ